MKPAVISHALLFACAISYATEEAQVTHFSLAQDVITLLSETELTLSTCTDEQSVSAALPRLKQLGEQARAIADKQRSLPDSSLNEDLTVAPLVSDFQLLWEAIRAHIERLENSGLMSEELKNVLRVAPTTN